MNYPINPKERDLLENAYYSKLKSNETEFDKTVKMMTFRSLKSFFRNITYKQIIIGDIKYLVDVFNAFETLSEQDKSTIKTLFEGVFSYNQPSISHFFENHDSIFNLRACHYCNLDSVSVFATVHGYKDDLEFIRHASKRELLDMYGIGKHRATVIMALPDRENYVLNNHIPAVKCLLSALGKTKGKNRNNFTLDHFIPQSSCCLFSRSLYNFIPSCYVCNSKLKKEYLFSDKINELYKYSPTYEKYESTGEIRFSLIQKNSVNIFDFENTKKYQFLDNFNIDVNSVGSDNHIVQVMHLRQRYHIHRETAVRLAYLNDKYSNATIAEIKRILSTTGRQTTFEDIKNDIFHKPTHDNESLSKLRKDIMKQLGI